MKKYIISILLAVVLLTSVDTTVYAKTNTVSSISTDNLFKVKEVKLGSNKVVSKKYDTIAEPASRVKFVAKKSGTYRFTVSKLSSSELRNGSVNFVVDDYYSNRIKIKNSEDGCFKLLELSEFKKNCNEDMYAEAIKKVESRGYLNKYTTDIKLDSGDIIFFNIGRIDELTDLGDLGMNMNAKLSYNISIKKVK